MDPTETGGAEFQKALNEAFAVFRPQLLIETGTYLGRGSTTAICRALADNGLHQAQFVSIEANTTFYAQALEWFRSQRMNVVALRGLSVRRSSLPTRRQIQEQFVENKVPGIFYDYEDSNRADMYLQESRFPGDDALLYKTLREFNWRPDFVLLDSAGHLGMLEFKELNELVVPDHGYLLMLDDTNHCKHLRTLQIIRHSPDWEILTESDERFGFALCRHNHK